MSVRALTLAFPLLYVSLFLAYKFTSRVTFEEAAVTLLLFIAINTAAVAYREKL